MKSALELFILALLSPIVLAGYLWAWVADCFKLGRTLFRLWHRNEN